MTVLAELLFEAFLMTLPYERQDIQFGDDRHRASREWVQEGEPFLAIYDQTYGSLRLTSRLLEDGVLRELVGRALDIARNERAEEVNGPTISALETMLDALQTEVRAQRSLLGEQVRTVDAGVLVIMSGSVGLNPYRENEEFNVEHVFFSPQLQGPAYRGRYLTQQGRGFENTVTVVPIDHLVPIPGVSLIGCFDPETGVLTPLASNE